MIKTSDEIRTILRDMYAGLSLERLDLEDRKWYLPTKDELTTAVRINSVAHLPMIPVVQECEEFSLHLMSQVRLWEAKKAVEANVTEYVNWAFGICRGDLAGLLGVTVHKMNICCTQSGVVIIEPQTNVLSDADPAKYDVWDITM
jgi:hypothetical protein